jgi:hypothetical protein
MRGAVKRRYAKRQAASETVKPGARSQKKSSE